MTTALEVHGICDARFASVRETLSENFNKWEVGASLAVASLRSKA